MAKTRKSDGGDSELKRRPPAKDPENRLQQVSAMAIDVLEERLRTGKATGAEIIFAAQFADPNRVIKNAKLNSENELLKSKRDAIESSKHVEELYENAIKAMKHYQGRDDEDI